MPQNATFIECWSYVLLNSLSALQVFFCHRLLNNNALMGLIPSEISTLTKLNHVYAPSLIEVIDCWSCIYWVLVMRAFSQLFKGALQRSLEQPAHRDNPTTNISAHEPGGRPAEFCWAVSPCFIECLSCAPLPHGGAGWRVCPKFDRS